ncbi:hypothetical protein Q3G72_024711 [Acer saccharum]|nr:hypothetical protein Q3G72_024711 [Acer saccharum]
MYTPSSAVALQGRVSIGRRPLLIRLYMHNIYNAMFISVLSAKGDLPGNSSALSLPYDLQAGSDVTSGSSHALIAAFQDRVPALTSDDQSTESHFL